MTKDEAIKAIDTAFATHLTVLFSNLCYALGDKASNVDPQERFFAGYNIAVSARNSVVDRIRTTA